MLFPTGNMALENINNLPKFVNYSIGMEMGKNILVYFHDKLERSITECLNKYARENRDDSGTSGGSDDKSYLRQPRGAQAVPIFRLLSIDDKGTKFHRNLIEIGTMYITITWF